MLTSEREGEQGFPHGLLRLPSKPHASAGRTARVIQTDRTRQPDGPHASAGRTTRIVQTEKARVFPRFQANERPFSHTRCIFMPILLPSACYLKDFGKTESQREPLIQSKTSAQACNPLPYAQTRPAVFPQAGSASPQTCPYEIIIKKRFRLSRFFSIFSNFDRNLWPSQKRLANKIQKT